MKKTPLLLLCLLIVSGTFLTAQNSRVVFVDGWVDLKTQSGELFELFIGDRVVVGDTVITGSDGTAELEPQAGSRIMIRPGTVFSVQERSVNGQTKSAVSCTLGQVAFVFNKMTGNEPDIMVPSATCGVRGTEVTVFAAADGSAMIIVDSGAVEVESQGVTVSLLPQEGAEIRAGQKPESFVALSGVIDFSTWNEQRIEAMMADPLRALANMEKQLDELMLYAEEFGKEYAMRQPTVNERLQKRDEMLKAGKEDEATAFFQESILEIQLEAFDSALNNRFYALSALSLRRHVLTGLYVRMKTNYIGDFSNPVYQRFLIEYTRILSKFENSIIPFLWEPDI